MKEVNLNDKRLDKRLRKVLSALGERPAVSIPAACGGFNEMTAAYRFFNNKKVTFEGVLASHGARTLERIAAQEVVLLVQDTTELDFTRPQAQVQGAGWLDNSPRRGAFLHPLVAFTTDGMPLGTCWSKVWTRETPPGKKEKRQRPIEAKESVRWLEGLRQAQMVAEHVPTVRCICVADSEADVYELFAEPSGSMHWLIRACQDRAVQSEEAGRLREALADAPVLFTEEIKVRARTAKISCETRGRRQPRKSRITRVAVQAKEVILRGPYRSGGKLPDVAVHVVQVRESDPPADDVPVEWLLLTSLPIETLEQVRTIIEYYRIRFLTEVFFRVLKSGCRVEERRFEHIERMLPCVALYLIVAWRTMMLCRLGRSYPELDCEAILEPAEWKSVWVTVTREQLPARPPPIAIMVPLIAQLGGYIKARKDPPGPQTVWLGLQRMYDLALAWNTFGPGAARDP